MDKQSVFDSKSLYRRWSVTCRVLERLDGGVPKDPKLIEAWVKAKTGFDDAKSKEIAAEHIADLEAHIEGTAEGMWTGFKSDETGQYYIEARQIKAMLREAMTVTGVSKSNRGSRQIFQHAFEVKGKDGLSKVYLEDCGPIQNEERAIHVMTAQGPRSAIKRTDFVTKATLNFEIWILNTSPSASNHISEDNLKSMLALSENNGLGANRSQGSGKVVFTAFNRLDKLEAPASEPTVKKSKKGSAT